MNDSNPITERAQYLLKILIERYIRDGQPVASRALVDEGVLALSPATIRNVMADLEHHGLIRAPHTSAGRVPTARGYRFFVDSLLTAKPLANDAVEPLQEALHPDQSRQDLVEAASSLLSNLTQLAGLVTLPRREKIILRHIEFLPLSDNRVLTILVVNDHDVQNRIIHTDRPYSASELQQAANYLSEHYVGMDPDQIRQQLLHGLQIDKDHLGQLLEAVVEMADKALGAPSDDQEQPYILAGQNNLLTMAEDAGVGRLRSLFDAFEKKRSVLHLLDKCLNSDGLQIFIGEESGYEPFDQCSLVTATYNQGDKRVGVLGVIGPTRMNYERVIPIVNVTAKLLSAALNRSN